MTEGRLRGPLSFKRWSVESLPDDDVSLDVVDGKMNALTGHKAEVAEQSVGEAHPGRCQPAGVQSPPYDALLTGNCPGGDRWGGQ